MTSLRRFVALFESLAPMPSVDPEPFDTRPGDTGEAAAESSPIQLEVD